MKTGVVFDVINVGSKVGQFLRRSEGKAVTIFEGDWLLMSLLCMLNGVREGGLFVFGIVTGVKEGEYAL